MAKGIITYGVNIETSTGAPVSHGEWRKLPAATLYRLKEILRRRGYVAPLTLTTTTSTPSTRLVDGPTGEELHITNATIAVEDNNKQNLNQARKALDVTCDNEHDSWEGQRPAIQIDMTDEANTTLSEQIHNQHNQKPAEEATAIIDLQGKESQEGVIFTSARRLHK